MATHGAARSKPFLRRKWCCFFGAPEKAEVAQEVTVLLQWLPFRREDVEVSEMGPVSRGIFRPLTQHHATRAGGGAVNLRGAVMRPRFVVGAGVGKEDDVRPPLH